jgi:cytochrome c-type biogenesis protein CcmH
MSPAARLSSADTVDVIARISQTGQPIAASGDLEGKQSGVAVTADGHVEIAIDRLLP